MVEAYADIPETLAADLTADMNATVGVKDGLHQAEAKPCLSDPQLAL